MANLKGFFLQNKSPTKIYPVIAIQIVNINNNHNSNCGIFHSKRA
jgi:hypothetical protein